ncbi:MAG: polysaccharide pyruvyl transferase family protein [Candidatus Omnitrophota bacterium]
MTRKIRILLTDLSYLSHNYGAQGIAFPLIEKFNEHFNAEYTFVLSEKYREEDLSFLGKYNFNFNITPVPDPLIALKKCGLSAYLPYWFIRFIKNWSTVPRKYVEERRCELLVDILKKSDVVIDISGIEFIGSTFLKSFSSSARAVCFQYLAEKYGKPYFKYTKSYGPFPHKIFRFFVKKQLDGLPFVFVRGEHNLKRLKKLNLKVPVYSFPDISIALVPESREWAVDYISKLGADPSKPVAGISPSSVIAGIKAEGRDSTCGQNHIRLIKMAVDYFRQSGRQVLLIPHSIGDGRDMKVCDLALSKKIYTDMEKKTNVFIIQDTGMTYAQARALIGLLNFYVTGRYHSVSSALSMAVPIVCLSWHIKYRDIMSQFLDDFLIVDCRKMGPEKSLSLIRSYDENRCWFDREKVLTRKRELINQIDRSVLILVNAIRDKGLLNNP